MAESNATKTLSEKEAEGEIVNLDLLPEKPVFDLYKVRRQESGQVGGRQKLKKFHSSTFSKSKGMELVEDLKTFTAPNQLDGQRPTGSEAVLRKPDNHEELKAENASNPLSQHLQQQRAAQPKAEATLLKKNPSAPRAATMTVSKGGGLPSLTKASAADLQQARQDQERKEKENLSAAGKAKASGSEHFKPSSEPPPTPTPTPAISSTPQTNSQVQTAVNSSPSSPSNSSPQTHTTEIKQTIKENKIQGETKHPEVESKKETEEKHKKEIKVEEEPEEEEEEDDMMGDINSMQRTRREPKETKPQNEEEEHKADSTEKKEKKEKKKDKEKDKSREKKHHSSSSRDHKEKKERKEKKEKKEADGETNEGTEEKAEGIPSAEGGEDTVPSKVKERKTIVSDLTKSSSTPSIHRKSKHSQSRTTKSPRGNRDSEQGDRSKIETEIATPRSETSTPRPSSPTQSLSQPHSPSPSPSSNKLTVSTEAPHLHRSPRMDLSKTARTLEFTPSSMTPRMMSSITPRTVLSSYSTPRTDSPAMTPRDWKVLDEAEYKKLMPKRMGVLNELLSTEKAYVRDLEILDEIYYKPITQKNMLEKAQITTLFSNFQVLYNVNKALLSQLEKKMENPNESIVISDVLLTMANFLKNYTAYVSNHEAAQKVYEVCYQDNETFARFVEEVMPLPQVNYATLPSFLIKPVQRICRYPLLIKELIKMTSPTHPDYEGLIKALRQLEQVADYVNEKKKVVENQGKILEICGKMKGDFRISDIVTPTRVFIKEATFMTSTIERLDKKKKIVIKDKDNVTITTPLATPAKKSKPLELTSWGKGKMRHFFLFNDVLIYTKEEKKKVYEFKEKIPLHCILASNPHESIVDASKFAFILTWLDNTKKYLVYANDEEERQFWVKEICNLSREIHKQAAKLMSS